MKKKNLTPKYKQVKKIIRDLRDLKKCGYAGQHLIADFWGVKNIEDENEIKRIFQQAVKLAKSTPLEMAMHKFSPHGITAVQLLAESHLSIHTWPEMNYVAVDIFTCGAHTKPKAALKCLIKSFKPKKVERYYIKRGIRA